MCHNRTKTNKIDRIRLIYNEKKSSFENLLGKDKSVSIYNKNLSSLAIEMNKVHRGISPEILNDFISPEILNDFLSLRQADQYNSRNRSQIIISNVKTGNNGFESLRYLGPKIWETIPSHLKEIDSLKILKMPSKNGNQNRVYVGSVKYIFKT